MLERLHAGRELQTVAALHGSSLFSGSGGPTRIKQPSSRPSSRSSVRQRAPKNQSHTFGGRRAGLCVRSRWWINKCLLREGMGGWLQSSTPVSPSLRIWGRAIKSSTEKRFSLGSNPPCHQVFLFSCPKPSLIRIHQVNLTRVAVTRAESMAPDWYFGCCVTFSDRTSGLLQSPTLVCVGGEATLAEVTNKGGDFEPIESCFHPFLISIHRFQCSDVRLRSGTGPSDRWLVCGRGGANGTRRRLGEIYRTFTLFLWLTRWTMKWRWSVNVDRLGTLMTN